MAVADFHGNLDAVQKTISKAEACSVALIIVAGDITHFGSIRDATNLLSLFHKQPRPVLFIPGNCDPEKLATITEKNVRSIHGNCHSFKGFSFLGVGGSSPTPFHTPFELTENEIKDILGHSASCPPNSRLILISHSPPEGTQLDMTTQGEHVGSSSIRNFITAEKPTLVICGHIHEGRGVDKLSETLIVNPGSAAHGWAALVDLNNRVRVKLCSLSHKE